MKCWWCEGEIDGDTALNDGGANDTVYQDGEPMHRSCRDAHLRVRELERQFDQDTDPQA